MTIAIGTRMKSQGGTHDVEWDGRGWNDVKPGASLQKPPPATGAMAKGAPTYKAMSTGVDGRTGAMAPPDDGWKAITDAAKNSAMAGSKPQAGTMGAYQPAGTVNYGTYAGELGPNSEAAPNYQPVAPRPMQKADPASEAADWKAITDAAKNKAIAGAAPGAGTMGATSGAAADPTKALLTGAMAAGVDWDGYRASRAANIRNDAERQRTGRQEMARREAARRGISPMDPLFDKMMNDIEGQRWDDQGAGMNALDMQIGDLQLGHGLAMARLPYELEGMGLSNKLAAGLLAPTVTQAGAMARTATVGADVAEQTAPARIEQIKALAQNQQIANEQARFELDQSIQAAPLVRQTAEMNLRLIEQQLADAQRRGDWARMDELGKLAAVFARNGGFKIVGGVLGGIVGSIIPGAGTLAGSTYGAIGGGWIDNMFGA